MKKDILISIFEPFVVDRQNAVFFRDHHGKFIDEIAAHFRNVHIMADVLKWGDKSISQIRRAQLFSSDGDSVWARYSFKNNNVICHFVPNTQGGISSIKNYGNIFKKLILIFKISSTVEYIYFFTPSGQAIIAVILALLFRKKIIIYVANEWADSAPLWTNNKLKIFILRKMLTSFETLMVRSASLIFCTSNGLVEKYSKRNPWSYKVMPLLLFTKTDIVTERTYENDSLKMLFVGSIGRHKRLHDIILALAILSKKNIEGKLSVVGPTDNKQYYQELEQLISENNLERKVTFYGSILDLNELRRKYIENDIFVLPSEFEGFPKVVYEAMIHLNSIVTSDINSYSGLPDGVLSKFPVGDYVQLAQLLEAKYFKNNSFRIKQKNHIREYITAFLSETSSQQLINKIKDKWPDYNES